MIMTSRNAIDTADSRVTSNAWVAELIKREGELRGSADPALFAGAAVSEEVKIPSGDAALRGVASLAAADRRRFPPLPPALRGDSHSALLRSLSGVHSGSSFTPSMLVAAAAAGAPASGASAALSSLSSRIPSDWLLRHTSALSQNISPLSSLTAQPTSMDLLSQIGLLQQSATMKADLLLLDSLDQAAVAANSAAAGMAAGISPPVSQLLPIIPRVASWKERIDAQEAVNKRAAALKARADLPENSHVTDEDIGQFDVLSGRGGKSNHHEGNKRFRQVVNEMKLKYRGSDHKNDKTALANAIVEYVKGYGARFLKKEGPNKWRVMTKAESRKKTSQALRETKELKWTL